MDYLERGLAGQLSQGIRLPNEPEIKEGDMNLKEVTIYAGQTHTEELHSTGMASNSFVFCDLAMFTRIAKNIGDETEVCKCKIRRCDEWWGTTFYEPLD